MQKYNQPGRKRTWTDEQFSQAVANNTSFTSSMQALGLHPSHSYRSHIKRLGLSTSHWKRGSFSDTTNRRFQEIPIEDILIKDSTFTNNTRLRYRVLKSKLLNYVCSECGLEPLWQDKALTLELHHINGHSKDNRIHNLTFLCPNCHSQTDNYKNKKRKATITGG